MPLMDRIYCKSFLEMHYTEQMSLVEKIRTIRSSALNEALVSTKKISKTKISKVAKSSSRAPKDITKTANAALAKLTPEQIELIKKQFASN